MWNSFSFIIKIGEKKGISAALSYFDLRNHYFDDHFIYKTLQSNSKYGFDSLFNYNNSRG